MGRCWDALGPAWSPVSPAQSGERREPSPTRGFASQALSVLSVHLCVCVAYAARHSCACAARTPAAARFIMSRACVSVNVDSVTRRVSHTFQNKRLPPRITIDPCGALGCIWKVRQWEREYTTSSLSLSLCQPVLWGMLCVCLSAEKVKKCKGWFGNRVH